MKYVASFAMFVCALTISPTAEAQDCSNWSTWDVRGTYTMYGNGWIDLSKIAAGLPSGTVPMSWVGAVVYNGAGGGTGWVSLNAGGVQATIDLLNLSYRVKSDCSMTLSYSMKFKELGATIGPVSRLVVIGGHGMDLELRGIQVGTGPGSPVDNMTAQRISIAWQ
jgi:hypothetical protein